MVFFPSRARVTLIGVKSFRMGSARSAMVSRSDKNEMSAVVK